MVRILSGRDVAASVTMDDIIPAVEHVFEEYAAGKVIMPAKIYLDIPGTAISGRCLPMCRLSARPASSG